MRKQRYHRILLSAAAVAAAFFSPLPASADSGSGSNAATQPSGGSSAVPFWLVNSAGQVQPYHGATDYGSIASPDASHPAVALAPTPDARGYRVASSNGGVFTFGDAGFYGSAAGLQLSSPVVGIASAPDSGGYWLVASDGGVFTFGSAGYWGSANSKTLAAPVVGLVPTPDGEGYWLVSSDGGVLSYGDATFYGSAGGMQLDAPVVGMALTRDAHGYWLVGRDGGVFSFGDAGFYGAGNAGGEVTRTIVSDPSSAGYTLIHADGTTQHFGPSVTTVSSTQPSASNRVEAAGALGQTVAPPPAAPSAGQTALDWAETQIGKPYGWAAAGPDAYDCSGLTMAAYHVAGISLAHSAGDQYGAGAHFPLSEAQPGDLVFWAEGGSGITHVGLYVGQGQVLHAPRSGETVRIEAIWPDGLLGTVTRL